MTFIRLCGIMQKLSANAAIAQSVERILGKDEVASSNLASSSKNQSIQTGWLIFLLATTGLNWRASSNLGSEPTAAGGGVREGSDGNIIALSTYIKTYNFFLYFIL